MGCQAFSHCLELLLRGAGGRGLGSPEVSHTRARLHPRAAVEEALTLIMITCSLLWLGSNRSNDLPGTHMGLGHLLPGGRRGSNSWQPGGRNFPYLHSKANENLVGNPSSLHPRGRGWGN